MATIDDIYKLVVENRNALNEIIANAKATGDLDPATPLSGTELIRIVQNGVSKWTSTDDLKALGGVGEDNVQSDWAQTDNLLDDYIKNKPINLSDFNDDLGYSSPVWGAITGTLSSQIDLQTALNEKAPTSHTHVIDNITGLQTVLDGKISSIVAGTNITVDITDPENPIVSSTLTFPAVDWGNIEGTLSDQTDLQSALDSKAAVSHTHTIAQVVNLQTTLDGKASTTHIHSTYDRASSVLSGANVFSNIVVNDGIVTSISTRSLTASDVGAADQSHGHAIANVTGLQTSLDSKIDSVVAGTNITVDNTDPNNPIINSTATGGASNWGDLGGTLSDQTDLQSALDAKINIFESALSKTNDYSTANNNSEASKLLIFAPTGAPHIVTLDDTALTIGFEQQVFNNSGQDITFTSSETINGSNIALANGYFAYYKLVAANEWVIAVGGSGGIGGGAVDSVNGQTGVVVLDYTDVGAAAASHTHAISDTTGLQTALDGKEDDLGNPLTNGYILSSTTGGTRSWIAPTSGGVTDHGALTGLADDDHPQYLTEARGAAIFATKVSPAFTRDIWLQSDDLSEKLIFQKVGNNPTPGVNWSIYAAGGSGVFELATEGGSIILGQATSNRTITQINTLGDKAIVTKEWVNQKASIKEIVGLTPSSVTIDTDTQNNRLYLHDNPGISAQDCQLIINDSFSATNPRQVTFVQVGEQQLSFSAGSGVTSLISAESYKTRKPGSVVAAIFIAPGTILLTGDLELL